MKVRYTRRALGNLRSIYSHIAVDNPKAVRAVESVIRETTDMLADFPDLGVRAARSSEFRGIKAGRYPYRINYRVRGGEVWSTSVTWHGGRGRRIDRNLPQLSEASGSRKPISSMTPWAMAVR